MGIFFLDVETSAAYAVTAPTLEVLIGGVVVSSSSVTAQTGVSTNLFSFSFSFSGSFPASVSLRFNDGSGEGGRVVTLHDVRINGQHVDTSYMSRLTMINTQSSDLTVASIDHLGGRVEPNTGDPSTINTGADLIAAATDLVTPEDVTNSTPIIIVAEPPPLTDPMPAIGSDGRDIIYGSDVGDRANAGAGDDTVAGNNGDDYINGGTGNDTLIGGAGADVISGAGGNDLIYGNADNDTLMGGAGNDVINGGTGSDALLGGIGADVLYGEAGADTLLGDAGDDHIYGDADNDLIDGGAGNDTIYGGTGDDYISGGTGTGIDTIYGEDGDDWIDGGAGNDIIDGGIGIDHITGGAGSDTIAGGANNDYLLGDSGNDTITGDAGDDSLLGGVGADNLGGGADNDDIFGNSVDTLTASTWVVADPNLYFSLSTNSFYKFVAGPVNYATAATAAAASTLGGVAGHLANITSSVENVFVQSIIGSGTTIWLGGSDAGTEGTWIWTNGEEGGLQYSNNAAASVNSFFTYWAGGQPVNASGSEDYLVMTTATGLWSAAAGTGTMGYIIEWDGITMSDDNAIDTLTGGTGNDSLQGGGGGDTLNGGDGNDHIWGHNGNDTIDGGINDDLILGGDGNDAITAGAGADRVYGGNDDDNITGDDGDDWIDGGAGIDTISGGNNNDTIYGGLGDDTLYGNAGNDTIYGDAGVDTIDAGADTDTIYLANGDFAATESIDGGTGTDTVILSNATTVDFTTGTIAGLETLTGSTGDDIVTMYLTHATTATMFSTIDLGASADTLNLQASGAVNISAATLATLSNIQTGNLTGTASDDTVTLTATQLDAILIGAAGVINLGGGTADTINLNATSADLNTLGANDDAAFAGVEILSFATAAAGVTINLLAQTEALTLTTGGFADTITLGSGASTINAGAGNDTINLANGKWTAGESLDGGANTDGVILTNATTVDFTTGTIAGLETLTGSTGNDDVTVYLNHATTAGMFTTINLGAATDNLRLRVSGAMDISAATLSTLSNIENSYIAGSAGDDTLTLTAAQFNAIIIGSGTVDMGAGTADTINLSGTAADLNTLGATDASIAGVEAISFATAGAGVTLDLSAQTEGFTATGGASADTLTLGSGNDVITAGGGADTIVTGEGVNTINLANGDFTGAESITGGTVTDTIVLTNATTVNFTTGTLTDIDEIMGSTGNDTVTLAAADLVNFATGIDLSGGTDVLNAYVVGTIDISADIMPAFSNIETGNITGSGGNNDILTLTAAQLDSILIGAAATVNLGAGTGDTLNFDGTSADLNTAGATDAYIAGVEAFSFAAATAGVTLNLSGQTEGFTITTGAYADTVTGGGGNDTINLANNDFDAGESITGGGGTDTLVLTNGTTVDFTTGTLATLETLTGSGSADTVTVSTSMATMFSTINLGGGTDNIYVNVSGTVDISAATLATITAENGYLTGTSSDDIFTLTGTQLNGILAGSGTVNLGAGNDTLVLTSTSSEFNTLGATDASIQGIETITVSGSPAITITLSAQTEDFTINGGGGVDTITGSRGNMQIYGNAGNDVITSSSQDTLTTQVTEITTAYSSVTYNTTTGSFYKYVNSAVTWATANTAAVADIINGVAGHLVQINNSAENSAIDTLGGANPVWIGVNDTGTEGTFLMIGGPMSNIVMRTGGAAANGIYANWAASNPGASAADDDYIRQENGGTWTDQVAATTSRYVIEWEGSQLLSADTTTVINGGTGNDTITLGAGQDYIILADWGAANADTINSYDKTDLDQIDIGTLLTGYVEGTSDPDSFARLTVSGADLLLQIDQDGTTGGSAYTTMATLVGMGTSGLNIEEMVANNLLIMTPAPGINFHFDWGTGTYDYNSAAIETVVFQDTDIGSGVTGNDMFSIDRTATDVTLDYLNTGAPGILVVTGSTKADDINITGIVTTLAATINLGGGNDILVIDTTGNVTVTGDAGNDTITTGSGNDTITGGAGADTMDGGSGNDTFNIATGWATGESITGGVGADDAIVFTAAATVDFSTGTLNTLERLTGFAGNDTVTMTASQWAMFTTIDLVSGTDVLNVLASGNISASGTPTVSNVDTGNLVGSANNDTVTMTGTQLNAILIGSGTIDFGAGTTDTLNLTSTSTDLNGLNDASILNLEYISASSAGAGVTITLSSQTEGFNVTGSSSTDTITGGSGGDTIDGGAGNVNDTLNGNGGTDTVSYASATAGVTVNLTLQGAAQNTVNAGNDTLSNFENLTGSAYADTLTGDGNANVITGGGGSDFMYGLGGNDTLNSGSTDTLAAQITAITTANAGVVYNSTTGSFYKFVNTAVTWTAANTAATGTTINGVAGHLIHVTSSAENSALDAFSGNSIWMGGNDTTTEGTFQYKGGYLDGVIFRSGGATQNGFYTNWAASNPGASSADDDYLRQRNGGKWYDATSTTTYRYVIEWEGAALLTPTNTTTLSGGAGTDTLYGGAGQDIFLFETSTSGTIDTISGYDKTDLDKIDIGDLLSGYTAGVSDVDDFARFTVSGADLNLQIDANGTTGGAAFTTIATLTGMGTSNLNITEMVALGTLIMT